MRRNSFCKTLSKIIRSERSERSKRSASLSTKEVVTGLVTFKSNEFALVNIGTSRDATLRGNDSWKYKSLEVGNLIEVYVEDVEKNGENVFVSIRELDLDETWGMVNDLCETGKEVLAKVVGMGRNGIEMEVFDMFGAIFWTKE
ncbi:MAG: hypothetical protein ACTS6H_00665, partial [Candidatus Hodgkinia cicadicola]